jgi:hypothetical protein
VGSGTTSDGHLASTRFLSRGGFMARLYRAGCARRGQSRHSEAFGGSRYYSDCNALQGHSPLHSRASSIPVPSKSPSRVFEMAPPLPCRCRRMADCNGKEYLQPLQSCLKRSRPTSHRDLVVLERLAEHPLGSPVEKCRRTKASSSACHERELTRSLHLWRMRGALP